MVRRERVPVSVSRSFGGSVGAVLLGAVLVALLGPATSAFQFGEGVTHSIAALTATERAAIAAQVGGAFAWVFGILAALTALGALLASDARSSTSSAIWTPSSSGTTSPRRSASSRSDSRAASSARPG